MPKDGNVSFRVFDSKGSEVRNYLNEYLQSGTYNVQIEGSDLPSGVYFYELRTDDFREAKRMILLK
ncbi:MAG: T9SS type A sorting domain-containing protein [Ignavibacteria bacterium]|nr:T9SS type A sorting domain-containing protein [Ignavibacteria bacterium]